jgi:hypothetical protein
MFDKNASAIITRANEQEALCIDSRSQLSATTESRIAFSTLEGRPSAYEFDTSPVLQDWVTATDIKLVLLSSKNDVTYYSLADIAVGGRCKCNGHASKCSTNRYEEKQSEQLNTTFVSLVRYILECDMISNNTERNNEHDLERSDFSC